MDPEIWAGVITAVGAVVAAVVAGLYASRGGRFRDGRKTNPHRHGQPEQLAETVVVDDAQGQDGGNAPTAVSAATFRLVIGKDGHFVGGDEQAIDAVVELLDQPSNDRRLEVDAAPLDDETFKREHPGAYVELRGRVRLYARALNFLLQGGVHYYTKWCERQLAEAVLELRRLALPGPSDREPWFVWPPSKPEEALELHLTDKDARSIRTAAYRSLRLEGGGETGIPGVPEDEPIWLKSIDPRIVWERVVPAVVIRQLRAHADHPPVVDLSDWVISDRRPKDLERSRPAESTVGYDPPAWSW